MVSETLSQIRKKNPTDLQRLLTIMTGDESDLLLMDSGIDLMIRMKRLFEFHHVGELMALGVALGIINGD